MYLEINKNVKWPILLPALYFLHVIFVTRFIFKITNSLFTRDLFLVHKYFSIERCKVSLYLGSSQVRLKKRKRQNLEDSISPAQSDFCRQKKLFLEYFNIFYQILSKIEFYLLIKDNYVLVLPQNDITTFAKITNIVQYIYYKIN